jgi:hypothetical protein
MATKKYPRKRLFVDRKIQGALVVHILAYWLLCLVAMSVMLHCSRIVLGLEEMSLSPVGELRLFYSAALVGTLLFLPAVVYNVVRLSHRFAGPMVRLRRAMRELARGVYVEPIRFRDGDFWPELAADFNAVARRIEGPLHDRQSEAIDTAAEDEVPVLQA